MGYDNPMKIVEVVPIGKSAGRETLSYFSASEIGAGALVEIPIRGKIGLGIVISEKEIDNLKLQIRAAGFELRKIGKIKRQNFLSPEFMEAVRETAEYFAATLGACLSALLPAVILEKPPVVKIAETETNAKKETAQVAGDGLVQENSVLQTADEERLTNYKSLIREEFAKKKSVFFCLPTTLDIEKISKTLNKGIEDYSFILHNSLPKKTILENWAKIAECEHPVLVIGSGAFLCAPVSNLGTIILENESSRAYKTLRRPYLDFRAFAEIFAPKIGARLVLGDSLLRTETIWRQKNGKFSELSPLKFRITGSAENLLINMKNYKKQPGKPFKILSDEIVELANETRLKNGNMFVLALRRGLSPQIVCGDCGATMLCKNCSSPAVLHEVSKQKMSQNFFICHKCGLKESASERCRACKSWRLESLGVGTELVEKEIKRLCPGAKVWRLDRDSAGTEKQARKIYSEFANSPGGILVGTEFALAYIDKKIERSAIASIDSLFSIPDFRVGEKIMRIIFKIKNITTEKIVVQTRNAESEFINWAIGGNLADFYRREIEQRQKFGYPPFSTVIKFSLAGKKEAVVAEMEKAGDLFKDFGFLSFPAFTEMVKGKFLMNGIIKVPEGKWPDRALLEKIASLPPQFAVNVDPENLL